MLGLALLHAAMAQDPGDEAIPPVQYPVIPASAAEPADFIPAGWKQVQLAEGDLNRDGEPDFAMVIRMDSERNRVAPSWDPNARFDTNPWMLIAAFKTGDGYNLKLADHRLIPRLENQNQEDPFDEIRVANGSLKVAIHLFMSAGGWEMGGRAFTFRWQDGAFKLIGFDRDPVQRNSGETKTVSINFLTGQMQVKTGNIGMDEEKTRTVRIGKTPLIDLDQIGDGLMFDPEDK